MALWCLAGAALLLTGCFTLVWATAIETQEFYPSPDRRAAVVVQTTASGIPPSYTYEPYLAGGAPEQRIALGSYFHAAPEALDGWRDARTYNICALRWADHVKTSVRLRQADGSWIDYRVTTECPTMGPGQ
jgi:hypothetical protein